MHVAKCAGIIACNAGWVSTMGICLAAPQSLAEMVIQALVEHMVSHMHAESSDLLFSGFPVLPYTPYSALLSPETISIATGLCDLLGGFNTS